MNNKKNTAIITVVLAAVLIAVLLGGTALYKLLAVREPAMGQAETASQQPGSDTQQSEQDDAQSDGKSAAPDFSMVDAAGNSTKLSDHIGKPLVLNFWASWCGPCKNEMPEFDAAAAEYDGRVEFMMVNLTDGGRETLEGAAGFVEEQGYAFPVYFDTLFEGAQAYSVRSIPVTYFIDPDGNVAAYSAGSMDGDTLRQGIEMILDE